MCVWLRTNAVWLTPYNTQPITVTHHQANQAAHTITTHPQLTCQKAVPKARSSAPATHILALSGSTAPPGASHLSRAASSEPSMLSNSSA